MASGTLDANSETFTVSVPPGQIGTVTLLIASTITVTATVAVGSVTGVAFTLPSGDAAAWTASDHFDLLVPGVYTFTASGVSGGTCDYETSLRSA